MNSIDNIIKAVYRKDKSQLQNLTIDEVNQKDQDGRTPLMHAILAENPDKLIINMLLEVGAHVNDSDIGQKWTPLHYAAADNYDDIVAILLEHGATQDSVDIFGNTPLWRSVMNYNSNINTAKLLVKQGANPQKKNNHGISPEDLAITAGIKELTDLFAESKKNNNK